MIVQQDRLWTIRSLMKSTIAQLQREGFDEARLNVELLLSHALNCQRIQLYTNVDQELTKKEIDDFASLFERRLRHEPVQYILGSANFMGLMMKVDSRVLIPRPETETLVEQTMLVCNSLADEPRITILDIGTGSGNIAITLARYVKNTFAIGIDNSRNALEVAQSNAKEHGVESRVKFSEMDIFNPVDELLKRRFDIIVSNPPYIARDEWESLRPEIRDFEPKEATTDSHDGFEFYRRIRELSPYLLFDNGVVLLEVGDKQASIVVDLLDDSDFFQHFVVRDLQGVDRVVAARCRAKTRKPAISHRP